MNQLHPIWQFLLTQTDKDPGASGGDVVATVILVLILLFFAFLLIGAVKKKLGSAKGRIGESSENADEAARTARLWAEARRKTKEEPDEEEGAPAEEERPEPGKDIQAELLEKAQKRRDSRQKPEDEARRHREALEEPGMERESPPTPPLPSPHPPTVAPVAKPSEAPRPAPPPPEPPRKEPGPVPAAVPAPRAEEAVLAPRPLAPLQIKPGAPRSLEDGLQKTRDGFVSKLSRMFGRSSIGADELEEIEEILFTADIGVHTSQKLIQLLQQESTRSEKSDPEQLQNTLKRRIESMLAVKTPPLDLSKHPTVILVVGVNGTGKTTTIGKLAMRYTQEGKKVVLAAGDTFRAAACEQLMIWGDRTGCPVIHGQDGGDPGAVIFDGIQAAKSQGADVVIADTAGRLHTKANLIEELRKIHRVCGKAQNGAPHEVWLVLDATTGQNAISQAKQFHKALSISGIVLTKLDGTAKGGVIIGICDTFGIPVRYIGIGEQAEDLRPFEPGPFVKALFS